MMKKMWFFPLVMLIACSKTFLGDDHANSPVKIFDEFWKGVDSTWPAFETKKVNWDSLYNVYRPQISTSTTNADLTKVMTDLILLLKDTHTNVYPKNATAFPPYPKYPSYFYGINWIKNNYLKSFKGNSAIAYGLVSPSIGYIFIASFGNSSDQYTIIDSIIKEFGNVKGIIIDVRNNGGGSSANSETIASRFTSETRLYSFARFRIGSETKSLGDFINLEISPSGTTKFNNKVAVLTNSYSYSATEDFVLMMKSFPQVIQLGDNTGGGSETRPIFKELPNGWTYRVASRLTYDTNKHPISKGIVPDFYVQTTKADSLNGRDSIIEKAIFEISK
jgi:hypothetical protein